MFITIIFNAVWVGVLAGILGFLVQSGWKNVVKSEEDKKTEALSIGAGIFIDLGKMRLFLLSILMGIIFVIWANYDSATTDGSGTVFGFIVWLATEGIYEPVFKKKDWFFHKPWQQVVSHILAFILWGWTIYLVAIGLPISGVYF